MAPALLVASQLTFSCNFEPIELQLTCNFESVVHQLTCNLELIVNQLHLVAHRWMRNELEVANR
eukprot:5531269-Lingulodinium_polyedra.AAC.1